MPQASAGTVPDLQGAKYSQVKIRYLELYYKRNKHKRLSTKLINMEQAPKKGTSSLTYWSTTESLKWSITQDITAISFSILDSHRPMKINDSTTGAYWLSCTLMLPFPQTAEASN